MLALAKKAPVIQCLQRIVLGAIGGIVKLCDNIFKSRGKKRSYCTEVIVVRENRSKNM